MSGLRDTAGVPAEAVASAPSLLTYDDVLLAPRRSSVRSRSDVSTRTRLTRGLTIAVPVVAANMETVTEARMAIAMARAGGVGIIHRFLTVADQVAMVERVKRAENLVIERAVPRAGDGDRRRGARADARCTTSRACCWRTRDGRLAGILTPRDLLLDPPAERPGDGARDAARAPGHGAAGHRPRRRPATCCTRTASRSCRWCTPTGASPASSRCATSSRCASGPHASKDDRGRLLVGAAIGVRGDYLERSAALAEAGVDLLVLDIAHGHADHAVAALERMRANHPQTQLVAGNVATAEGADDLSGAGADAIKVGVGPGSVCTTRVVAGVGVPQLSAVVEAVAACRARTASRSSPTAASAPRATWRRRSRPARRR